MHTLGKMVSPMEKTQSPAERFYESIYYSDESLEEDYLAELRNFSSDHWDTALRAARLSAAVFLKALLQIVGGDKLIIPFC